MKIMASAVGMATAAAAAAAAAAAVATLAPKTGQEMALALNSMSKSTTTTDGTNAAIDKATGAVEPDVDDTEGVKAAKQALQAKTREFERKKITREGELMTKLDEGKPAAGAPDDEWKAWKAKRQLREKEARLEFTHDDEDNALVLKGLEKAVEDARVAARATKEKEAERMRQSESGLAPGPESPVESSTSSGPVPGQPDEDPIVVALADGVIQGRSLNTAIQLSKAAREPVRTEGKSLIEWIVRNAIELTPNVLNKGAFTRIRESLPTDWNQFLPKRMRPVNPETIKRLAKQRGGTYRKKQRGGATIDELARLTLVALMNETDYTKVAYAFNELVMTTNPSAKILMPIFNAFIAFRRDISEAYTEPQMMSAVHMFDMFWTDSNMKPEGVNKAFEAEVFKEGGKAELPPGSGDAKGLPTLQNIKDKENTPTADVLAQLEEAKRNAASRAAANQDEERAMNVNREAEKTKKELVEAKSEIERLQAAAAAAEKAKADAAEAEAAEKAKAAAAAEEAKAAAAAAAAAAAEKAKTDAGLERVYPSPVASAASQNPSDISAHRRSSINTDEPPPTEEDRLAAERSAAELGEFMARQVTAPALVRNPGPDEGEARRDSIATVNMDTLRGMDFATRLRKAKEAFRKIQKDTETIEAKVNSLKANVIKNKVVKRSNKITDRDIKSLYAGLKTSQAKIERQKAERQARANKRTGISDAKLTELEKDLDAAEQTANEFKKILLSLRALESSAVDKTWVMTTEMKLELIFDYLSRVEANLATVPNPTAANPHQLGSRSKVGQPYALRSGGRTPRRNKKTRKSTFRRSRKH